MMNKVIRYSYANKVMNKIEIYGKKSSKQDCKSEVYSERSSLYESAAGIVFLRAKYAGVAVLHILYFEHMMHRLILTWEL